MHLFMPGAGLRPAVLEIIESKSTCYLLYNSSHWGPTSVTVHTLLVSRAPNYVALPHSLGGLLGTICTKTTSHSYKF